MLGGAKSWDDLIRSQEHRWRDRDPERPSGLEVDDQIEFRRTLDRQVARLGAFEDTIHLARHAAEHLDDVGAVGHESAVVHKGLELVDSGQPIPGGELNQLFAVSIEDRTG